MVYAFYTDDFRLIGAYTTKKDAESHKYMTAFDTGDQKEVVYRNITKTQVINLSYAQAMDFETRLEQNNAD